MIIRVEKFGKMLISRPAAREAASIMLSSFVPATNSEDVELDFTGIQVIAPSWPDEVLQALRKRYGDRVKCLKSENLSLNESLKTLRDFP